MLSGIPSKMPRIGLAFNAGNINSLSSVKCQKRKGARGASKLSDPVLQGLDLRDATRLQNKNLDADREKCEKSA